MVRFTKHLPTPTPAKNFWDFHSCYRSLTIPILPTVEQKVLRGKKKSKLPGKNYRNYSTLYVLTAKHHKSCLNLILLLCTTSWSYWATHNLPIKFSSCNIFHRLLSRKILGKPCYFDLPTAATLRQWRERRHS